MPRGRKENKNYKWMLLALGLGSATAVLIARYLLEGKEEYLKSAWSATRAPATKILTSPTTGTIVAAATGPLLMATLHHKYTLPRQQEIEASKQNTQWVYSEMEGAYREGIRFIMGNQEEKIQPNYAKAAESFKKARDLLGELEFDEKRRQSCL